YDLIYMDIGLPGIDGYQTTKSIREKEKSAGQSILIAQQSNASKTETPIIALTGHGVIDVKTFCGEAGMQGVLSKPLSKDQAEKVWQRYVKQKLMDVPGLVVFS
ncbi:MAG: response regulator, partial [Pseudomonadota bacterium]